MRSLTVAVLSAAVVIGMGGAVVAYELAAPPARSANETTTSAEPARQTRPATRPQFAPCAPPAKLERGVCVTDEVRTVVLLGSQVQTQQAQVARDNDSQHAPGQVAREHELFDDRGHDGREDDDDRDDDGDNDDNDDDRDGDKSDDGGGDDDDRDDDDRDDDDRDDDDRDDDDRDDDDRDDDDRDDD